jgi:hypothetical protein
MGASLTKQLVLRIALPHLTLVSLAIAYTLLGACVFTFLSFYQHSGASSSMALRWSSSGKGKICRRLRRVITSKPRRNLRLPSFSCLSPIFIIIF